MASSEPMVDITKDQTQQQNAENGPAAGPSKAAKKGATRMAGFMFWINVMGVVFLIIGYAAPGWLTARMGQRMHTYSTNSWDDDGVKYISVVQDYGLWYITQCQDSNAWPACETLSYRLIDAADYCNECKKLEIGKMEKSYEDSKYLSFSGAGLVFSISEINRIQAFYTLGLLLALASLHEWYSFRNQVAELGVLTLSKRRWVFLFFLAILSALFVFIPVAIFASIPGQMGKSGVKVKSPVGSVFAGFGGATMVITAAIIILNLVFCKNAEGAYICNCGGGATGGRPQQGGTA